MYSYIIGKITEQEASYITLESNNIGYLIYTGNPYSFELNKEYKVYLYNKVAEDENTLYGFKTKEERDLFLKLISVKGLGCKMALPMLATGTISGIIDAIERDNSLYLKKFPKIGEKVARQIILDLKGKLVTTNEVIVDSDLVLALEALGYKNADIKKVLPNINKQETLENQIKEALRLLLK